MTYSELKDKHAKEFGEFPIVFAFSNEQFTEALKKLAATEEEVCATPCGGIIKKSDSAAYVKMVAEAALETEEAMKNDAFLIDAIRYELGNHEFGYTFDPTDTLECLGLSLDDERTFRCFTKAKKEYLAWDEIHNN